MTKNNVEKDGIKRYRCIQYGCVSPACLLQCRHFHQSNDVISINLMTSFRNLNNYYYQCIVVSKNPHTKNGSFIECYLLYILMCVINFYS